MVASVLVTVAVAAAAAVASVSAAAPALHHVPLQRAAPPSDVEATRMLARKSQHWDTLLRQQKGAAAVTTTGATHNLALQGNVYPLGIYGTTIGLGSPLQEFVVAVDSGSCTLLVPGYGCKGCNQTVAKFDPSKSSTCVAATCAEGQCSGGCVAERCHFSNSYQTCNLQHPDKPCTISGPVWHDKFSFGADLTGEVPFGTITFQTPGFEQLEVIDGIVGMACESTFFGRPTPLFALAQEGKIEASLSFCFGYEDKAKRSGFSGGVLTLGGYDRSLATSTMKFTSLLESMLYVVNMSDVKVAGHSIGVPPATYASSWGGTVLDSGTNILLLPQTAFDALYTTMYGKYCGSGSSNNLKGLCGVTRANSLFGGKCFQMTEAEVKAFPTLQLTLQGMDGQPDFNLQVPPSELLLAGATNHTKVDPPLLCFGVKNSGPGGFTIIGDTVMSGYVMLLDRGNSRVGWATADRSKCSDKSRALLSTTTTTN